VFAALVVATILGLWRWFPRDVDDASPATRGATTNSAHASPAPIRESPASDRTKRTEKTAPPATERADFAQPANSVRGDEPWKRHRLRIAVVRADDGTPVESALVIADERTVHDVALAVQGTTGADGAVVLDVDPRKGERVTVRKVGFVVARAAVPKETPNEVRVELAAGVPQRGRVVFADSRAPAAGVPVRAWRTGAGGFNDDVEVDVARTTTEDGRFDFAGMPADASVRVYAVKPGYRTADALVAPDRAGQEIELVLGEGGVMEGVVYDTDGKPMADVDVYQMPVAVDPPDPSWNDGDATYASWAMQGFVFPPTKTDAKGRYEMKGVRLPIDGVPQPRLAAARDLIGRTAKSEPATFTRHAERMQRDVHFKSAAAITVHVAWASPPTAKFKIRVQPNGPNRTSEFEREVAPDVATTTFEGLLAGLYFVGVETGDRFFDGTCATRDVTVTDGDRADVSFAPTGNKRIEGVVVDAAGRPVPDLTVQFETGERSAEGSFEAWTTTRADGTFALEGLAPTAGTIEINGSMNNVRRLVDAANEGRDGDAAPSFAPARVHDVTPGGPSVRIVLQRDARVIGRIVPPPAKKNAVSMGVVSDDTWGGGSIDVADDGRFIGALSVVGRPVDVFFHADGFASVVFENRTVAPGATLDVGDVNLEPGLTFEGLLRDVSGTPLANAEIYGNDPWLERALATDADGKFRLDHLPRRAVHLSVAETHRTPSWRLTIDPAVLTGVFTVGEGIVVAGRALDATGGPARSAHVRLLPSDAGRMETAGAAYFDTDADGRFEVRVAPGRYRVELRRREYVAAVSPAVVDVKDGENAPIELRLR